MNFELFIAKRIYKGTEGEKKISPPAVRIAVVSIALGLAVMILSVCIVIGFKQEVRNKIIGFGSHIQVTNFDNNHSYETQPIAINDTLINEISRIKGVRRIEKFATKPGIIKTDHDFQGIVLKGVDENFDTHFFKKNLIEGVFPAIIPDTTSTDVIISKILSDKLNLKLNDSFISYFIQDQVRYRKFKIAGIYQTNFSEYDKLFIIADIKQVKKLNNWDEDLVSGLEIMVDDYENIDQISSDIYHFLSYKQDRLGNSYYTRSVKQLNPMIFSWLDLLDMNVVIILILMILVAGFTTISGLLIIILERANMIGILKALGQSNNSIRKIFLYISFFIITRGLFWGNLIALCCCYIQKYFSIVKLDPEVYYIPAVPIELNYGYILLLNAGTLIASILILLGPSYLVSRISPAKTIRFE